MCKKIITERTFADALETAVGLIRARKPSLKERHILFVPDKYTLLAEKLLYDGTAGAFDAEVLTLNRLYYRLQACAETPPAEKPLGRIGAVLYMRKILTEHNEELKCLKRGTVSASFAETVYDNLCQFMASGLKPDDLPDTPEAADATGKKVHDLKLLYAAYEAATKGKFVDSAGRMRLLVSLVQEGDALKNTHVYFAGFDALTKLQALAVDAICEKAASATVVERAGALSAEDAVTTRTAKRKRVQTYLAPSRADELKAAAVRLRAYAKEGVPYGEMGVVASRTEFNRLQRIFEEYGIPFFTDRQYALSLHPLARYLCDLFAVVRSGRNEDYIRLSKNPYTGIDAADADAFENYIYACALGEGSLKNPFKETDETLRFVRDRAERVRGVLRKACEQVEKAAVTSGEELLSCVKKILKTIPPLTLASPIENAAEKIEEAAAVLAAVYGSEKFDTLAEAFAAMLASVSVSVLPNRADTVEVGEPSAFRASRKRVLFVLGLHEGELPAVMADDGLLSDRELDTLTEIGAAVEPKIRERNARAEQELLSVLASSTSLWLSRVEGYAPSGLFLQLQAFVDESAKHTFAAERKILSGEDGRAAERESLLLRLCPTPAAARALLQIGMSERQAGGNGHGYEATLKAALCAANEAVPTRTAAQDDGVCVDGLYFTHGVSVSRVQEYFTCPLLCFLQSGLKLKPRPDGVLTQQDIGEFMHRVIEAFSREGGEPDIAVPKIVERVLRADERLLKGVAPLQLEALTKEAVLLAGKAADQNKRGDFTPAFFEEEFGKEGSAFGGIEITVGDKTYIVGGKIDRLDLCGKAARIIDYKTGNAEFDLSDLYYGKRVQLAVYMKVAAAKYTPAGMFYFPLSTHFEEDKDTYRLKGMFDSDYAVAMDRGLSEASYDSTVIKAKTTTKAKLNGRLAMHNGAALRDACDYGLAVLTAGAEEMVGGYIAASPLQTDDKYSPCTWCEMTAVCRARRCAPKKRTKRAVDIETLTACLRAGKQEEGA